ncbi:putative glutamine-rich protein 2 [Scophthalmus maximus]|uniref:Putative glutamine-rich protein 2 n=1 Tax=Scophthalmus maximus TaxID=52904 RepID=A0A2U9CV44_SCOMX|nr:putative glutamine-rich protein 2 [Scophthalmus maximus]
MSAESNNSNLFDMLDSFIETQPVNNRALNALLHAMLRRLHILEKNRRTAAAAVGGPSPTEGEAATTGDSTEVVADAPMDFPMEDSAMPPSDFDGQSKLRSRIQVCEDGLSQVRASANPTSQINNS